MSSGWQGLGNSTAVMSIISAAGGSIGFSLVRDVYASRTPPGQLKQCKELLAEVDELMSELSSDDRIRITLRNPHFMDRLDRDIRK